MRARLRAEDFACIISFKSHLLLGATFSYHLHFIAEKMEAQRGNSAKVSQAVGSRVGLSLDLFDSKTSTFTREPNCPLHSFSERSCYLLFCQVLQGAGIQSVHLAT